MLRTEVVLPPFDLPPSFSGGLMALYIHKEMLPALPNYRGLTGLDLAVDTICLNNLMVIYWYTTVYDQEATSNLVSKTIGTFQLKIKCFVARFFLFIKLRTTIVTSRFP